MSTVQSAGDVNITLGNKIFLETLIIIHLLRKFPAFCGIRRPITVFTAGVGYFISFSQALCKNIFPIQKKGVKTFNEIIC
jgi:hypothetical protein